MKVIHFSAAKGDEIQYRAEELAEQLAYRDMDEIDAAATCLLAAKKILGDIPQRMPEWAGMIENWSERPENRHGQIETAAHEPR